MRSRFNGLGSGRSHILQAGGYAAAKVIVFDLPAYAETAAGGINTFALGYASKTAVTTRSEIGLRSDKSLVVDGAMLTLRARGRRLGS
jgi:hypothetical protein